MKLALQRKRGRERGDRKSDRIIYFLSKMSTVT